MTAWDRSSILKRSSPGFQDIFTPNSKSNGIDLKGYRTPNISNIYLRNRGRAQIQNASSPVSAERTKNGGSMNSPDSPLTMYDYGTMSPELSTRFESESGISRNFQQDWGGEDNSPVGIFCHQDFTAEDGMLKTFTIPDMISVIENIQWYLG